MVMIFCWRLILTLSTLVNVIFFMGFLKTRMKGQCRLDLKLDHQFVHWFTQINATIAPQEYSNKQSTESSATSKWADIGQTLEAVQCWLPATDTSDPTTAISPLRSTLLDYLSDEAVAERTQDCDAYFNGRPPTGAKSFSALAPVTQAEVNFPLAWAISGHHQIGLLELFLASVYRPTDALCLHIDAKASETAWKAASNLVHCYQQRFPQSTIILPQLRVPVLWGTINVLEGELRCIRALLAAHKEWKVVLNPAATSLPIVSAGEMRRRLAVANGSVIDSFPVPEGNRPRFQKRLTIRRWGPGEFDVHASEDAEGSSPGNPPYKINLRKGSKDVALTRDFVNFLVEDAFVWTFYDWIKETWVPDEHFYSTLATIRISRTTLSPPNVTDETATQVLIEQDLVSSTLRGMCVRFSRWFDPKCAGQEIRGVCNFAIGDLDKIRSSGCIIANKFNLNVSPEAAVCQAAHVSRQSMEDASKVVVSHEETSKGWIEPEPQSAVINDASVN